MRFPYPKRLCELVPSPLFERLKFPFPFLSNSCHSGYVRRVSAVILSFVETTCTPKRKLQEHITRIPSRRGVPDIVLRWFLAFLKRKHFQFTLAVVTLQTFYLGKHDLLTVYLGKLDFLSVTDFFLGNLPRGNFIVWVLDMSRKQ